MKRSRFTEEKIAFALKQQEVGTSVEEDYRKLGQHPDKRIIIAKRIPGL